MALTRSNSRRWLALALAVSCLGCGDDDSGTAGAGDECGSSNAGCDAAAGAQSAGNAAPRDAGGAGAAGSNTGTAGSAGGDKDAGADASEEAGSGGGEPKDAGGDCTPDCAGRECGDDPACGTSCGTCATELECMDGTCVSTGPPRDNGEACTHPAQCMSGHCNESAAGDFLCYGDAGPNDPCTDTFDCAGGVCTYATTDTDPTLCVEAIPFCVDEGISDACIDAALAFCRLYQRCGSTSIADYDDFDLCVGFECQEDYTSAECTQYVDDVAMDLIACP